MLSPYPIPLWTLYLLCLLLSLSQVTAKIPNRRTRFAEPTPPPPSASQKSSESSRHTRLNYGLLSLSWSRVINSAVTPVLIDLAPDNYTFHQDEKHFSWGEEQMLERPVVYVQHRGSAARSATAEEESSTPIGSPRKPTTPLRRPHYGSIGRGHPPIFNTAQCRRTNVAFANSAEDDNDTFFDSSEGVMEEEAVAEEEEDIFVDAPRFTPKKTRSPSTVRSRQFSAFDVQLPPECVGPNAQAFPTFSTVLPIKVARFQLNKIPEEGVNLIFYFQRLPNPVTIARATSQNSFGPSFGTGPGGKIDQSQLKSSIVLPGAKYDGRILWPARNARRSPAVKLMPNAFDKHDHFYVDLDLGNENFLSKGFYRVIIFDEPLPPLKKKGQSRYERLYQTLVYYFNTWRGVSRRPYAQTPAFYLDVEPSHQPL